MPLSTLLLIFDKGLRLSTEKQYKSMTDTKWKKRMFQRIVSSTSIF